MKIFFLDNLSAQTRRTSIFAVIFGPFVILHSQCLIAAQMQSRAFENAHLVSIYIPLDQNHSEFQRRAVMALRSIMAFQWDSSHRKRESNVIKTTGNSFKFNRFFLSVPLAHSAWRTPNHLFVLKKKMKLVTSDVVWSHPNGTNSSDSVIDMKLKPVWRKFM